MDEAFVYLWYHGPTKRYYLGYHKGTIDDGYSHSSKVMESWDANNPPKGWRRRILATGSLKEMADLEHRLLSNRRSRGWFGNKYINLASFPYIELTHERRKESAKKRLTTWMTKTTPEQRSEIARKANASMTSKQRSEAAKKRWSLTTPEQRSEIARKRSHSMTPEQRSELARKAARASAEMRAVRRNTSNLQDFFE